MKFEDIYNTFVTAACVVVVVMEGKKAYDRVQAQNANQAADRWEQEATARLHCMMDHAKRNRISKVAYVETLEAAKNVLSFEVDAVIPGNVYAGRKLRNLFEIIDAEIAIVK